jgi:UDP:flavonoid glycosyltransferase YjiC (YdhE family)
LVLRPGEVTGDEVRAALERVLGEPSFAEAAGAIAREIEQMGDVEATAQAVEEHAAPR